jgi:hypothetical protein
VPVQTLSASGGEVFYPVFTGFSSAENGEAVGLVAFPDMDEQGSTYERGVYVPVYDSEKDYSTENLIDYDSLDFGLAEYNLTENPNLPVYTDPLYGGYRNWSYGIWTGYYEWDETQLVNFYQNIVNSRNTDESEDPLYLTSIQKNLDESDNSLILDKVGSTEQLPINDETLIGDVSSYYKTEVNDEGGSTVLTYKFCAYMEKDLYHPSRKGGDSIESIPKAAGTSRGDKIPYLSQSKGISHDLGGGVSFSGVGVNFGKNQGTSWQYSSVIDLNGDRFPDLIKTSMNGGSSAQISLGTGIGFSPVSNISIPFGKISLISNISYSFGGSSSAAEGTQKYTFENGRVKNNEVSGSSSSSSSA